MVDCAVGSNTVKLSNTINIAWLAFGSQVIPQENQIHEAQMVRFFEPRSYIASRLVLGEHAEATTKY